MTNLPHTLGAQQDAWPLHSPAAKWPGEHGHPATSCRIVLIFVAWGAAGGTRGESPSHEVSEVLITERWQKPKDSFEVPQLVRGKLLTGRGQEVQDSTVQAR